MKANSLSINIPYVGCNKICSYCVSSMTGKVQQSNDIDIENFYRKLKKAKTVANHAQVNSIILTGKGEPLLNQDAISKVCEMFSEFPIEVQTNGKLLRNKNVVDLLYKYGVDTVAISIDSKKQLDDSKKQLDSLKDAIKYISLIGNITIRLTVNLVNDIMDNFTAESFIEHIRKIGVHQVSFREITIPNHAIDTKESIRTQKWIKNNVSDEKFLQFMNGYNNLIEKKGVFIQSLPFGASIYMIDEISCTYFDYCVQDSNNGEDIRSLIYWEDGHMSCSWYGSNYGRVF